jgi:hypothetical protein
LLRAAFPVLSIDGLCIVLELLKGGFLASVDKITLDMSRESFVIGSA